MKDLTPKTFRDNAFTAVVALSLQQLSNVELASANLAVSGFGAVPKVNLSHVKLLELSLIKTNGNPCDHESLRDALALEVHRRIDAGTFN